MMRVISLFFFRRVAGPHSVDRDVKTTTLLGNGFQLANPAIVSVLSVASLTKGHPRLNHSTTAIFSLVTGG